jgi:hypothetical protein
MRANFAYNLNAQAMSDLDQIGIMDYDLDYANHAPLAQSEADMGFLGDHPAEQRRFSEQAFVWRAVLWKGRHKLG